jgi:ribonuclease-3
MAELRELEADLGVRFTDKSLLHRSLVHRSYLNEHPDFPLEDNERLEFLGDAVLDFVTGEYLYNRFPEMQEGLLTSLRAALVRRDTLARFAQHYNLGEHILMGLGEDTSGGRERPAILCATFEAVVGALYIDQGVDAVKEFVEPLVSPEIARTLAERSDRDHKSMLQEMVQARHRSLPRYSTVSAIGPDHAKEFTVVVSINGAPYGRGVGRNKQEAAQRAAEEALERFGKEAAESEETDAGASDTA